MPTSDTRTQASMTMPLSRTRSRTSIRLLPPAARSTAMWELLSRVSAIASASRAGTRQGSNPAFEALHLLAQVQILLKHLFAPRREVTVVLPPIEADLLSLVDRTDHQADANREQLDFSERNLDVARHHEPLVEDAIENINQLGAATARTPCEVSRHRRCAQPARTFRSIYPDDSVPESTKGDLTELLAHCR